MSASYSENITNSSTSNGSFIPRESVGREIERQMLLAYYCFILLATVTGNSLVCVAIYMDHRLRSPTNWFIASLAVSDLLYGSTSLPFRIASHAPDLGNISVHACRLWIWADMACAAASIANLAAVSVDRRLKITHPFTYHLQMTNKRAFSAICGVWGYAVLLASLALVRWPGHKGIVRGCANVNHIFYTIAMVVGFMTPLIILVINYCFIYATALKQFRRMRQDVICLGAETVKRGQMILSRDFKATKTLAVVIGTFCVCWCPFFIIFTILQNDPAVFDHMERSSRKAIYVPFFYILPNLNAVCNPIIYAYFNRELRQAFRFCLFRLSSRLCKNRDTTGSSLRFETATSVTSRPYDSRNKEPEQKMLCD